MSRPARPGRVAAIDFGTVRIGIAVSDPERTLASPWENYTRRNEAQDAEHFRLLVREERIKQFVVGLPVHLSGEESEKSREARAFGRWLQEITGVAVDFFDERFTSAEAERHLLEAKAAGVKMTKKRIKARLDMLAAQILLAAYLESGGRGQQQPGAIDDGPIS